MTTPQPQTILAARTLLHENSVDVETHLADIARANGLRVPFNVQRGKIDPAKIPTGSTIVFDNPNRISDTLPGFIKVIANLIAKDCRLIRGRDPTTDLHDLSRHKVIFLYLALLPNIFRASKIRVALANKRLCGARLGREPIGQEIQDEILRIFSEVKTIRGTARRMSGRASRSSVFRVLKSKGVKR